MGTRQVVGEPSLTEAERMSQKESMENKRMAAAMNGGRQTAMPTDCRD